MNIAMGSQRFIDVTIPLLWGTRAVLQDSDGRLSVIDLGETNAKLEIVGDSPAPGVRYSPRLEGFAVLDDSDTEIYKYSPLERRLSGASLRLPDCQITKTSVRVGTNTFSGNMVSGYGVGIGVSENGMFMGGPLPPGLAQLVVDSHES